MKKTGTIVSTSAATMLTMALTMGLAPASQATPLSPAVTASVATTPISTTIPAVLNVTASVQSDWYASRTLDIINQRRAERGLKPLRWNQGISDVSQDWANHLGQVTASPSWDFATIHRPDAGGSLIPRGATWYREVVVFSFTPEQSVDWWMNSPGHRDAIMSPTATDIGIGYVTGGPGQYNGWKQMVANLAAYPNSTPAPAPAPVPSGSAIGTAKTTYDVNFRSGPSTGYSTYGLVPAGSTVNVLGSSSNGWTPVNWNGRSGYISTDYLTGTVATPAPAPAPAPAEQVLGSAKTLFGVNFRSGPGLSSSIYQMIPQGASVNLLSNSVNGWHKVSYAGKTGYVSSAYLSLSTPAPAPAPAPVVSTPTEKVIGSATAIYAVNFRAGASTGTAITGVVPQGSKVDLLGASVNGWTKVSWNGKTGYISTPYLNVAAAAKTQRATENVNFRTGASTNTGIIQVVPAGSTVNVITPSVNGWTQVSFNGRTGYIYSIYLA